MIRKLTRNNRFGCLGLGKMSFSSSDKDFDRDQFIENLKELEQEEEKTINFFHYKVLDLPEMASNEDIKTRFRTISNNAELIKISTCTQISARI